MGCSKSKSARQPSFVKRDDSLKKVMPNDIAEYIIREDLATIKYIVDKFKLKDIGEMRLSETTAKIVLPIYETEIALN